MNHFEQCGRWMAEMKIDRIELAFLTVIFVLRATGLLMLLGRIIHRVDKS